MGDATDKQLPDQADAEIAAEVVAVERWFWQRGLPNLIDGYSATGDVFTRAAPLLVALWLFGVAGAYGDRFTGWSQALAAVAGFVFLTGVGAVVNRFRGRRNFQVPDHVGVIELSAFVLAPAFIPVILGNGSTWGFIQEVALGLAVLAIIWFWFGFGLGAIIMWAVRHLFGQIVEIVNLMMRSLPLLLLFTMFLFLNAELWQVANDFTTPLFYAASGGLVGLAALFVLFRVPGELRDVGLFADAGELTNHVERSGAPLLPGAVDATRTVKASDIAHFAAANPLSRPDRINVAILTMFAIGVQIALVMCMVGAFYIAFGLVAVRPTTIEQWTTGGPGSIDVLLDISLFGTDLTLTYELLKVTGFLMAFGSLHFTVAAITDSTYRAEFFEDLTGEIRDALAVRLVYLDRLHGMGTSSGHAPGV